MSNSKNTGDMSNLMRDAVLTVDYASFMITRTNPAAQQLSGYSPKELSGIPLTQLFPALSPALVHDALEQSGGDICYDEVLHSKDDRVILTQLRINTAPLKNALCLICVVRDITPIIKQQPALKESKRLYDSLVDAVPELVFRIDSAGTYLDYKIPRNLGLKEPRPEEIIGKKIKDIVPAYVNELAMPAIEKAIASGGVQMIEYDIEEPGGLHSYEARFVASVENEVIAVVTDVTPRKRAEASSLENQMTARALLDAFPDIALLMDREWTILATNQAFSKRYNKPIEQLIGTNALDPLPPAVAELRRRMGEKVLKTGKSEYFEDFNQGRHYLHSVHPLRNANGVADRIAAFARDITEQTRNQALLKRQQALLEGVAQATTRLLVEIDVELAVQTAINILGEKVGVDRVFVFKNHPHPQTKQPATTCWKEWIRPGIPSEKNKPVLQNLLWQTFGLQDWYDRLSQRDIVKDLGLLVQNLGDAAQNFPIQSLLVVPVFIDNEFWGCVGFDHRQVKHEWSDGEIDVLRMMGTSVGAAIAHQRAKENLRQAHEISEILRNVGMALTSTLKPEEIWGSLLEHAKRVVPYTAANVMSVEGNEARIVNVAGYEKVGMSNLEVKKVVFNVEENPIIRRMIQTRRYYRSDDTYADPLWVRVPGTDWLKSWLGVPIVAKGKVVGFFSMDATEPDAFDERAVEHITAFAEQAARAFQNALLFEDVQNLEQIKSEMIRIASHDLRSPLTRILNLCQKIEGNFPANHPAPEMSDLTHIREAAQDMNQIINELLSLERIEARYRKAEPLDWCKMIEYSVNISRADLEAKRHHLEVHCAADLPIGKGNSTQLEHAILNMIQNAIKYTPAEGKIEVRALLKTYTGQPVVAIEVEDNGIGVPAEEQAKVFEPFYRSRRSHSQEATGIGLGLSVVKTAVEDHRGRVYLDSVPGEGSLFGFWIPV
ncbi:MAG: PAS domain-containing protein [Chloroflexi bacterium]|nr:PAS domain-containing protein [Chloroflexota bacterium]